MFDFFLGVFTNPISLTVFFLLTFLFIIDLIIYSKIYRNLKYLNYELDMGNSDVEPIKSLLQNYKSLIPNSFMKINSSSYLEAYFSDYQLNLLAPFDCQAQSEKGLRVSVVAALDFIHRSISLFILVGVLGTFLGLYYSLSSLPVMEIDLEQFGMVMSGIQIAFNTSIVGMSYAILIKLFIKLFNAHSYLEKIMAKLENYLDNDLYYQRASKNPLIETISETQQTLEKVHNSIDSFESFATEFKISKKHMKEFNHGLQKGVNRFEKMYQGLEEVYQNSQDFISGFKVGVKSLNNNFEKLFSALEHLEEYQQEYNNTFKQQLKKQADSNQLFTKQLEILDKGLEKTSNYFTEYKEQIDNLIARIETAIQRENKTQIEVFEGMKEELEQHMNNNNKQYKKHNKVLKELANKQDNLISACEDINQYNSKLSYKIKNISNNFAGNIEQQLDRLEEIFVKIQEDYDSGLSEVVEQFKEHTNLSNELIRDKFKNMDNLLAGFLTDIDFNIENLEDTIKELDRDIFNLAENIKKYNNSVDNLQEIITQLKRQRRN